MVDDICIRRYGLGQDIVYEIQLLTMPDFKREAFVNMRQLLSLLLLGAMRDLMATGIGRYSHAQEDITRADAMAFGDSLGVAADFQRED